MTSFYRLKHTNFIKSSNHLSGFSYAINPDSKFLALGIRKGYIIANLNYSCFLARRASLFLFGSLVRRAHPAISLGYKFYNYLDLFARVAKLSVSYFRDWIPGLLTNYRTLVATALKEEGALRRIGIFFKFPDVFLILGDNYNLSFILNETKRLQIPTLATGDSSLNFSRVNYLLLSNYRSFKSTLFFLQLFLDLHAEAKRFRVLRHYSTFKRIIKRVYLRRTLKFKLHSIKFAELFTLLNGGTNKFVSEGITNKNRTKGELIPSVANMIKRKRSQRELFNKKQRLRVIKKHGVHKYARIKLKKHRRARWFMGQLNKRMDRRLSSVRKPMLPIFVPNRMLVRHIFPLFGYFAYGYMAKRINTLFFYRSILRRVVSKRRRILSLKRFVHHISVIGSSAPRFKALKVKVRRKIRFLRRSGALYRKRFLFLRILRKLKKRYSGYTKSAKRNYGRALLRAEKKIRKSRKYKKYTRRSKRTKSRFGKNTLRRNSRRRRLKLRVRKKLNLKRSLRIKFKMNGKKSGKLLKKPKLGKKAHKLFDKIMGVDLKKKPKNSKSTLPRWYAKFRKLSLERSYLNLDRELDETLLEPKAKTRKVKKVKRFKPLLAKRLMSKSVFIKRTLFNKIQRQAMRVYSVFSSKYPKMILRAEKKLRSKAPSIPLSYRQYAKFQIYHGLKVDKRPYFYKPRRPRRRYHHKNKHFNNFNKNNPGNYHHKNKHFNNFNKNNPGNYHHKNKHFNKDNRKESKDSNKMVDSTGNVNLLKDKNKVGFNPKDQKKGFGGKGPTQNKSIDNKDNRKGGG